MENSSVAPAMAPWLIQQVGWAMPFTSLGCCYLVTALVVGFTPASSPLRPLAATAFVPLTYAICNTAEFANPVFGNFIGMCGASVSFFLASEYITKALVEPWEYDAALDAAKARAVGVSEAYDRLCKGLKIAFAHRGINAPRMREAQGVPPMPAGADRSRIWLMLRLFLQVVPAYLFVDVTTSLPEPADKLDMFGPHKIPVFARLLADGSYPLSDALDRVILSVMFWVQWYCALLCFFNCSTIASLAFHLSGPADYRPMFGPVSRSYTVRNFWGVFWHQTLRNTMSKNVDFVVHNVLRVSKAHGNLVLRYAKITLVFVVSGIIHWGPTFWRPDLFPTPDVIQYFITQAMGIMIEDGVQALVGADKPPKSGFEDVSRRCVGFAWTILFQGWSLPIWSFPMALPPAPEKTVPLSFVRLFGFKA